MDCGKNNPNPARGRALSKSKAARVSVIPSVCTSVYVVCVGLALGQMLSRFRAVMHSARRWLAVGLPA